MPLEPYQRGQHWWVRGRIEFEGQPISGYYRCSTGASTEAGAREWIKEETDWKRRRHLIGDGAEAEEELTLAGAVALYNSTPAQAKRILNIVKLAEDDLLQMKVRDMSGQYLKNLAREIMPNVATDTMWREVVSPLRSVINNAHERGKCGPVKVKPFSQQERVDQDTRRGKQSRVERTPSDRNWVTAFCEVADVYNAAMLRFMFETAARIDQAVSLVPSDLDLPNCRVWLKAQKGHPAQWVVISHEMMVELANLPPKKPRKGRTGQAQEYRVFGYATNGGYRKRWQTICKRAGIPYITAHPAGRHGYFTELHVRQGVSPVDAAKSGRWSDPALPMRTYAHAEKKEADIRALIRTNPVQRKVRKPVKSPK